MLSITSVHNPKIKQALSLHEAKGRKGEGLYLIEGERELSRYLQALSVQAKGPSRAGDLVRTFICETKLDEPFKNYLKQQQDHLGECILVNEAVMEKLSFRQSFASVIAIARKYEACLEELIPVSPARFVVAQGLEKPGNLGALWRVADAVGVTAILICGPRSDIWSPAVIRSSMGSFFHIPAYFAGFEEILAWASKYEVQLLAATPEATTLYDEVQINQRCALILGSEDEGLDVNWRAAIADQSVQGIRLPMLGAADSLNVSCAGSVLLYDILRRQKA
jgi:TrmH family RNA methyltransferase